MNTMSVRELNANVSAVLAKAEKGEDILLTRNGKPILRITRDGVDQREVERQRAVAEFRAFLSEPHDLGGPATYDERTGR